MLEKTNMIYRFQQAWSWFPWAINAIIIRELWYSEIPNGRCRGPEFRCFWSWCTRWRWKEVSRVQGGRQFNFIFLVQTICLNKVTFGSR